MNDAPQSPDLCLACIGDEDLKERLLPVASQVTCTYCHQTRPGLSVQLLAEQVDPTLRSELTQGAIRRRFALDSDASYYEQDGDDLVLYVQELLQVELEPAEAVVDALIDQDPADPRDGDDPFYARDQQYELADVVDWEFAETWWEFSATLKHDQRFFGSSTASYLVRILGKPGSSEAADLPVFTIASSDSAFTLYRARRANSADHARSLLSAPDRELAAPAPEVAVAGRMNPAGISVFYGAMSEEVAIAEVRPAVGGIVVVGAFLPVGPLRLLDLTRLREIGFAGSVFAPNYQERVSRARFLRGFHRLIVQPVQPQDEPLEYLPTQAVAEYVRNVLGFDGILYASTQVGALDDGSWYDDDTPEVSPDVCNVVVFGRSSRQYSSDSFSAPVISGTRVEYPLKYEDGSAHGVWVRRVAYVVHRIDLDDERGNGADEGDDEF